MTEIIKHKLYLGSIEDANDLNFLYDNNIEIIISVAYDSIIMEPIRKLKQVYKFEIEDSFNEEIIKYFSPIIQLIDEKREKGILVHCIAGVSRSATIIIAYLMTSYHMSLLEAYYYVKSKRPQIKPNHGFIRQLVKYEFLLYGTNSVRQSWVGYKYKNVPNLTLNF